MRNRNNTSIDWKSAEYGVKARLEKEFKKEFTKLKMPIGEKMWEFDLVSKDKHVVVQVKSCQKMLKELSHSQLMTRFKRGYIFDCLLLEKARAHSRLFYLVADRELFNKFKTWSDGLVDSSKVESRYIDPWK